MNKVLLLTGAAALLAATASPAPSLPAGAADSQAPATTPLPAPAVAPGPEHDFDYLLGDWEYSGVRKEEGGDWQVHGLWSAMRLGDGAKVLDEFRMLSEDGETLYLSTTLRAYDQRHQRWDLVSADPGTGLQNIGTAYREGSEMRIEQTFDANEPTPSLWRIRYHDIRPDRFSWKGDRSRDGGKTWVKDFMVLEARRIGPARTLEPLTTVKAMAKPKGQ
jgi:hypothetical protein